LDADRGDLAALVEEAGHPDDGVELQQRERGGRVVEVDPAALERLAETPGQGVEVDLETDGERRRRADAGAQAAVLRARNGLVQMQLAAPEVLVTEGVKAKDLPALIDELAGVVLDGVVEVLAHRVPRIGPEGPDGLEEDEHPQREAEADWSPPA